VTPSVALRRVSEADDLAFLSELARDPAIEPFLAPGRGDIEALRELNAAEPPHGLYVIEAGGERVGGLALASASRAATICEISRVMVRPEYHRAGVALAGVRESCRIALLEHEIHRIEAQVYSHNLAAQRLFERAGFTREGARRRAYWRHEQWLDGIYYGLLAEEL
jgi:RimJ/RimL family protein N-acetyltransferase